MPAAPVDVARPPRALRAPPWAAAPLVVLFFTALTAAMFAPLLAGGRWFLWDVPDEYWADLVYLCGSLRDGVWPLWNPYDRFGYPFHADPQAGLYYPLNHALCLLSAGRPPLILAELRAPLHFVLAGSAMTGFLRARGLAWGPALLGGTAFLLAPYQRRMWEVNTSYTIAYLPAVLWAIERLAQSPSARRAAVLALLVAVATSVGSPPSLYHTAVAASVFALARCAPARASWPWLLAAGALAAAMCAVMIEPTRELMHLSVQENTDFRTISAGGYELRELVGLVWLRNKYLYLGVPVLALAAWGAARPSDALTPALRATFALLGLYALLMTLGDHTPLYRAAFHLVPGVSAFRAPVRYSAVLGACAAVLAAAGAARLPRPRASVPLAVALVVAVAWPALPPDRDLRAGPVPGTRAQWDALRARLPERPGATDWRAMDELALGLRAGTRFGFRDARGYQDPLQFERYARVINGLSHSPAMLPQYGVGWLFRGPHFIHGTEHHFLPAGREGEIADDRGGGLWQVRDALPAAYWVERAEVAESGDAAIARLRAIAPAAVCVLEAGDGHDEARTGASAEGGARESRAASRFELARNTVRIEYDAPRDGWLVVNETWHPGWRAVVDGAREARVFRANFLMRAVRVPAGRHRVEMVFRPASDGVLRVIALIALIACVGMMGWRARPA